MMDSIKMDILKSGEILAVNAPPIRTFTCPYCGSDEGTMLSRDEEKVLFTCFRAKCPENGSMIIPLNGASFIPSGKEKQRVFTPKEYVESIQPLTLDKQLFLEDRFDIDPTLYNISLNDTSSRYLIPLYTILGTQWGWGSRSYNRHVNKKFILYKYINAPNLYFPPMGVEYWRQAETVVITEDVFSAMKVSEHLPAVSILGTSLGAEQINALAANFTTVIIWLDYDTWQPPKQMNPFWLPKPKEMKRKMQLLFKDVHCICSREDPKDMTHESIKGYLDELR